MPLHKFSPRSFDWTLAVVVILLLFFGAEAIYSVDLSRGAGLVLFKKQMIAGALGIVLCFIASLLHYNWFRSAAKAGYWVTCALLVLVLIFGTTIRETRGWFVLGNFSFQPVEAVKVGLILMLAYIVANFGRRFERPLFFVGTALVTLIPIGLVLVQPDLGSAILLGAVWLGLMLLVGARKIHLALLVATMVAVGVAGWFFLLADYQKDRLRNFVNPSRDPLGSGYNVTQSIIAVGSGQIMGRGLGFGSQSQLRFLPEAQTDFIFSVIAEELGFIGAATLLVLYGLLFWRLVIIMKRAPDDFGAVAVGGIAVLFFAQFIINIGAEIGLMPVTGIPLPFVSYGGSALLVNLLMVGIAESMVVKKY